MTDKTIHSMMDEKRRFAPAEYKLTPAHVKNKEEYDRMYEESIKNPESFWTKQAEEIAWFSKFKKVRTWDHSKIKSTWFEGGKLNVSYNCLDRHLNGPRKNKAAIIWEGELPGHNRTLTYQELHREVCRFANVLKKKGVKKGDRVCIYLPMIPELPIAMLACARIGAIHSIVFGGFSAEALRDRIQDSTASMVITSDGSYRRGKVIPLKDNADKAIVDCPTVKSMIVVQRANAPTSMKEGRDSWFHDEMNADDIKNYCEPEHMDAEDPLFILYTSGTTGKPKGVLHTTAGYLLYVTLTTKYIFDVREEDTFWCTADIGWVTGHSYIVYGPLSNGVSSLMFEGVPNFPKPDRFWEVVEKYKVNVFYTAPTAIRAMAKDGDQWPNGRDLSSIRLLGSVGEPINPEAWIWYHKVIGKEKCPIVDTYWQTETGGIIITPIPGVHTLKPSSANRPFFGVQPIVVKENGQPADVNEGGYLCIKEPWPGMMRTVYGDHQRFVDTYWTTFKPYYFTGDGARMDEDGDFWLMGRVDDVINIAGHRLGTAEVESALVTHPKVAEAAVVPMPDDIKGQGLYAYVILKEGNKPSDELKKELENVVRKVIGPIAKPDKIQFADALPKTRSGKIMRRILRKIAEGANEVGDTTTLADPHVVEVLLKGRQ
ncbi:Acetyl-coenzyme A synthetase [uncultured archaeon]|nr:Acetyl-coenzyme A synthetase [uncultured archaeon]